MRLTQINRSSIVRSIMADVPQIDFDERAHEIARKFFHKKLPAAVRRVKDDKTMNHHLRRVKIDMPGILSDVYVIDCPAGVSGEYASLVGICQKQASPEYKALLKKVEALSDAKELQRKKYDDAKAQLTDAFNAINTNKRALEIFPQFEKYIPKDESPSANLPALTTVVSDLEAIGWPSKPKAKSEK